jgi:long-chain acyl-CoA synthetase
MLLEPLLRHASNKPDALAIRDDRGTVSFAQLATMAAGLSQVIARATSRDRVGILLPASSSFAACTYGAMLAGKAIVPINFLLSAQQIAHMIVDSGIDVILTAPPLAEKFAPIAAQLPAKLLDLSQLPGSTQTIDLGAVRSPRFDDNAMAVLLYTSGTSGLPKGVPLTHKNLSTCVEACITHVFRGDDHHFLGLVPLFHSTGFTGAMLAPIQLGAPVTYIGRFSPVATVKTIREEKADIVLAVPSMYGALMNLKTAGPEDFAHVFALICGGEPLSGALRDAFEERFKKPLLQGYGLSETCGPIAVNAPHARRDGSVGQLVPCGKVRVVDETNQALAPTQTGEILLGGPSIMQGYHNLPDATRDVMTKDGFFRTGDLGHVDADGYLFITGRAKDMIIISGEKLAPREIEELLVHHELIAEAAVVGKKDESRGEVPVAFVVPKEGQTLDPASAKEFLKQFNLPNWKLPKEVIITDALPRSPTGKVLKRELVARL